MCAISADGSEKKEETMPYIKPEKKVALSIPLISMVSGLIRGFSLDDRYGAANYIVTRIIAHSLKPSEGWSYISLSRAIAVLEDAAHEMRRRLLDPYEDAARKKNGDLPEYENKE